MLVRNLKVYPLSFIRAISCSVRILFLIYSLKPSNIRIAFWYLLLNIKYFVVKIIKFFILISGSYLFCSSKVMFLNVTSKCMLCSFKNSIDCIQKLCTCLRSKNKWFNVSISILQKSHKDEFTNLHLFGTDLLELFFLNTYIVNLNFIYCRKHDAVYVFPV